MARDVVAKKAYQKAYQKARLEGESGDAIRADRRAKYVNTPHKIKLRNANYIKRKYGDIGISIETYDSAFEIQHGLCAICGGAPDMKYGRLAIDHDHKDNRFRALLCRSCNSMLGFSKDSIEILTKAIEYLKLHSS